MYCKFTPCFLLYLYSFPLYNKIYCECMMKYFFGIYLKQHGYQKGFALQLDDNSCQLT